MAILVVEHRRRRRGDGPRRDRVRADMNEEEARRRLTV